MLKGPYTAIIISVLLHLLVLFTLTYSAIKQPKIIKEDKPKLTAIKSFLYSAPKKIIKQNSVTKQSIDEKKPLQKTLPKRVTLQTPVHTEQVEVTTSIPKSKPSITLPSKAVTNTRPAQVTNAVKSETVTTTNKVAGASRGSFSSYDRLSRLRQKLGNQQSKQAFSEFTQKRSASVMDGEPFPVPKAIVPLTVEQKTKLNTSTSHVGSITKNDNGTCTIHREQMLGSPVQATTASFACGESKFDKNFREHMQKVQAKFSPYGKQK